MRLLIFTDLDGTLLDHDGYEWSPARPALARIRQEGWPLVFVTSKTRAEVEGLRAAMAVDEPFVVENGAAAFFPERLRDLVVPGATDAGGFRALVLGRPYRDVRAFVERSGGDFGIEGFGDMAVERVAELTGLPLPAAALAKARDFTEPFLLPDDADAAALAEAAGAAGLKVTRGGRFHHLIGAEQDKGVAVRRVADAFAGTYHEPVVTIGLGDGLNDVPMLRAVDHAVLVPAPGRPLPDLGSAPHRVAPAEGPAGWSAALLSLFAEITGSESEGE